ncbi:MAG TPA: CHAT domain-containing tetratricopeptide repeat protein [Pyrinomonadaceae bacterium]|nr:CHAT domain-containing tetratricopeptide repeat protein [Pyrinomonadaceae bacterium]
MITHRISVLLLALFALTMTSYAQNDAQIEEEDYRVKSVADRERAVASLRSKADELRQSGQLIEAARALNRVGRFQIRMSEPTEAIDTFKEAIGLLDQQPDINTRIDNLNGLASSYDYLSKCNLAEPLAAQIITLSKQHNYVPGQAEALLTLSDCQNHRDHALAQQSAEESLRLWRSINRKRGMAEAYKVIGHDQLLLNKLIECGQSMQAAFNLYNELNDLDQQASVLIYLAMIENRKGAWQNALALYTQVQSMIDEKAEPYKMGQISNGMGDAFLETGLPDVALEKFRKGLDYFRITKNQRAIAILHWSIGRAQYFRGDYDDALNNLQTALTDAQARLDVTLAAYCDDFLGRTHAATGNHSAALSSFRSAIGGYSKARNPVEVARTHALIGRVYEDQGQISESRKKYQTALKTFQALSDHVNESATLFAIGNLELKQNNLTLAEEYLRQAIESTENIRRISTSNDLMTAFSATVHERYQSYIECLMRKHKEYPDKGFDVQAFEISELSRARSLAELLRATETNLAPGIDPKLTEEEKFLRQSIRVKEDYKVWLLSKQYKKADLDSLNSEIEKLRHEHAQITDIIRTRFPSYTQITQPLGWDLRRIQRDVLPDDTMLLEYSMGPQKSYVWLVTRNSFKSFEIPREAEISDVARKVYELVRQPLPESGDKLAQASRELSQMVLSPISHELNKRSVIIVADGVLHFIPFQILPSSSANTPLIASHEVINAPSASILGELQLETTRRQPPPKILAAFGDPIFANDVDKQGQLLASNTQKDTRWQSTLRDIELNGDSFDPSVLGRLFHAKRELDNLRQLTAGAAQISSEYDATRDRLLSTDLTQYAMLHFATHGFLNPKHPENSGFVLSTVDQHGKKLEGFIGLREIYELRAPVSLVVLSACQTGLGKDVRGEGLISLTRGFMYAGASGVVASLWKVDDRVTAELMRHFYSNLLEKKMTPAAALREAQNTIRQKPDWNLPYYWAAFTLQGDYGRVIEMPTSVAAARQRTPVVVIIFGVLIVFTAIGYSFLRFRIRTSRIK